jgi:RNA polymerase sigma factor (sigma-70 family)
MRNVKAKEFKTINAAMVRAAGKILHLNDDAKDVASFVWEKFITGGFDKYDEADLSKVMTRAAYNRAMDIVRSVKSKRKKLAEIYTMDIESNAHTTEDAIADMEISELKIIQLHKELDKLATKDAKLIRMKYMDGFSYEEIARELGGNEKSLCVQSGRILRKMKLAMCA